MPEGVEGYLEGTEQRVTREQKLRAVAEAFMKDDPQEYEGQSVEDVMEDLRYTSEFFLSDAYDWFVKPTLNVDGKK